MGGFVKLSLDGSIAVPVGVASVRVVAQAQSKRGDAVGWWRVSCMSVVAGALVVGEAIRGTAVSYTHLDVYKRQR